MDATPPVEADGTWKVPATVAGRLRLPSAAHDVYVHMSSFVVSKFEHQADGTWKVPATLIHCDSSPIICTIRSVTPPFNSVSISSYSRGRSMRRGRAARLLAGNTFRWFRRIFGLLVIAKKKVGDRPDEGGTILLAH